MVDVVSSAPIILKGIKVTQKVIKHFKGAELWIDMAPRIEQTNRDAVIHIYDSKEDEKIELRISKPIRKNVKRDIYHIFANAVCKGVRERIESNPSYSINIHKHEYRGQEQRLTDLIFNKLIELNENFKKKQIKFFAVFPDDKKNIKKIDAKKTITYTTW
jgi:hypothetical protein